MKYKTGKREPLIIDANWFMTKGGGRFVGVESFAMVRNFLSKQDGDHPLPTPPKGTSKSYDPKELANEYVKKRKNPEEEPALGMLQYEYGFDDPDFIHRTEVFGSSAFHLNPKTQFVIKDTGDREIRDAFVIPNDDDYDFVSSSLIAKIHNTLIEEYIDPWGIGHKVDIQFNGKENIKPHPVIDDKQAKTIEKRYNSLIKQKGILSPFRAEKLLDEKKTDLRKNSIIYWREAAISDEDIGNPIVYGSLPQYKQIMHYKAPRDLEDWE